MTSLQRFCTKTLIRRPTHQLHKYFLRHFGRKAADMGSKPRRGLTPVTNNEENLAPKGIIFKAFGFTALVGGVSFGGCAIWQYESLRKVVKQVKEGKTRDNNNFVRKAGSIREHVNYYWNNLAPGQKVIAGIMGINFGIFLAWRIQALGNVMLKYFVSSPFGKAPCWSLLFSNWSHHAVVHIFVNMYVLWSCGEMVTIFGKEQFVAFYTTAGVFSAFTGSLWKIATKRTVPSLGASGAILAVLASIGAHFPDSQMSIAFINQLIPHSFSAKTGIIGIMCLDTLGLILRWRLLDHAAHLGGVLFGLWYVNYGPKWIWAKREGFLKLWHGIRGKP